MKNVYLLLLLFVLPLSLFSQLSSGSYQTEDNGSYTSGSYSSSLNHQNFLVNMHHDNPLSSSSNYSTRNKFPSGFIFLLCEDIDISVLGPTMFCEGGNVILNAGTSFDSYQWSNNQNTSNISVSSSGDYYVLVSDSTGCSSLSDTINVSVWNLPSATIGGVMDFCDGDSVELEVSSGFSDYLWSTGSINSSVYVNQTDTLFVEITDSNGCSSSSDTAIVNAVSNPTPSITQIGPDSIFTELASSYQWYQDGVLISGATNQFYLVSSTGNYSVLVENGIGCIGTSLDHFVQITGIRDVLRLEQFNLFPNPTSNKLFVSAFSREESQLTFELRNVLGQSLMQKQVLGSSGTFETELSLTLLPSAYYFLIIRGENGVYVNHKVFKME